MLDVCYTTNGKSRGQHILIFYAALSTHPSVAYLPQLSATAAVIPPPTTTMSDWKAPMTKLVNQIYSKADAGKSISRVCWSVENFPPFFFTASCWTSVVPGPGTAAQCIRVVDGRQWWWHISFKFKHICNPSGTLNGN